MSARVPEPMTWSRKGNYNRCKGLGQGRSWLFHRTPGKQDLSKASPPLPPLHCLLVCWLWLHWGLLYLEWGEALCLQSHLGTCSVVNFLQAFFSLLPVAFVILLRKFHNPPYSALSL